METKRDIEDKAKSLIYINPDEAVKLYKELQEAFEVEFNSWDAFYAMQALRASKNPDKNWVIPDVRFPNEVKMIQGVQGQVWQVRRGELPNWFLEKRDNNIEPSDVHASEWAWIDKDSSFEQIIQNDGSLEELLMKLKTMV